MFAIRIRSEEPVVVDDDITSLDLVSFLISVDHDVLGTVEPSTAVLGVIITECDSDCFILVFYTKDLRFVIDLLDDTICFCSIGEGWVTAMCYDLLVSCTETGDFAFLCW